MPSNGHLFGQNNSILKDTSLVLELNRKAEVLRYKKSDSIKLLAQEALDLSIEIQYEKGIIYSLYNLALHELYQGNTSKSIEYYNDITQNPNLKKYPALVIKLYNDMAQAYFIRAEHPKAFEFFLKSKKIADETKNVKEIVRINSNLGTLFLLLEDYDEALGYYHEASRITKEDTPLHIRGLILANLGYLKNKQDKPDEALTHLNEGIEYLIKTDYSTIIAFAYLTLGDAYNLKMNYKSALEYYEKSEEECIKNGDKKGTADLYFGKAEAYQGLMELDSSKMYVQQSLELYTEFGLKSGLEKCNRLLYELSKHETDLGSSLAYLELAEAYSDTISKEQNKTNILMLKTKLAHEEEKRQLAEISTNTISKQKSYIVWSLAFLLLAITGMIVIYQSNEKRKNLNKILAEKTKVLYENEKILNETNKTKDKLFSIVGHDLRGPIVSLKELLKLSLKDKDGESQFQRFGPKLQQDLDHIQFTLDNLLNWGQTQMKGASTNPVKIMVKSEIEEIKNLFQDNLQKKELTLFIAISEDLCALADINHFRIIFRNLISNAIKFSNRLDTIKVSGDRSNEMVTISVIDNGIGISQENIDKIWSHKEHFSTFGTKKEKGTGLGLSLCKEMTEKNNGSILLESTKGKGSIFHVHLPSC